MPFGIKLRRTAGRYILSHKNSFLVRVQLLDNTIMECTLTVENTGNDCLNAVANKLDLKEVQYFGLWYVNKQTANRWVELEKPLKKQVDKNAQDPTLHFGVMYYVANMELLQQEITRYLFYLQLKNNVIDGYLPTTADEAIELASYMLQAEFRDHNPEVHTVQYFRDFIVLPEAIAPDEETLDSLTEQVLTLHQRHRALTPPDSEYNYVLKVIHLEGYGEEVYHAKDIQNADYEIGCSFLGIVVRKIITRLAKTNSGEGDPQPSEELHVVWHEWGNIDHVTCSKSTLVLSLKKEDVPHQFLMEDAETAKYVARMFEQRRKFYSLGRQNNKRILVENAESSIFRRPTLRRTQDALLPEDEVELRSSSEQQLDGVQQQQAEFLSSQENLQMEYSQHQEAQYYASQTSLDHAFVSQTSLNRVPGVPQDYGHANGYVPGGSVYSSSSINSLVHSQTHLDRQSPASSNMSLHGSERHLANGGVPMYRCTPDYEQAVRQRRRYSSYLENQAAQKNIMNNPNTAVPDASRKPRPHSMIYSPQELLQQAIHGPHYAQYPPQNPPLHYRAAASQRPGFVPHDPAVRQQRQLEVSHESLPRPRQQPLHAEHYNQHDAVPAHLADAHMLGTNMLAASTPELANTKQQAKGYSTSEMQLLRYYTKPPPPYPPSNSTSTPDLSLHRHGAVSASSPDLHHPPGSAPGQQRPPAHQPGRGGNYAPQELTVIRGVCTGIEPSQKGAMIANSYDNNNARQDHNKSLEQSVQAYLQQLAIGQASEAGSQRMRNAAQRPAAKQHRPVSYPPRLNQVHPLQLMENDGQAPVEDEVYPYAGAHSLRSRESSSTSTVESPYGSQQYLHGGSQISLHRTQLAPANHPVITDQPTPQRADTVANSSVSSNNYHHQPPLVQQHDQRVPGVYTHDSDERYLQNVELFNHNVGDGPQHSQMPSNATMLVHSSGSESDSEDEARTPSADDDHQPIDYRHAPLTTIDNWHREGPKQMYVPPKPKPNHQIEMEEEHWAKKSDFASQQAVPSLDLHDPPHADIRIPTVATEDHDPPHSYRKPVTMESYDETDVMRVSVFPHPNPSQSSLPQPNQNNPFLNQSLSKNNPFFVPETSSQKENHFDIDQVITELEQEAQDIDVPSEEGSHVEHTDVQSSSSTFFGENPDVNQSGVFKTGTGLEEVLSPPPGTPDDRVHQLEKRLEDGQVLTEYDQIPRKRASCTDSSGDPLRQRDRVKSVTPYPDNRVKLSSTSANPDGYINASHVQMVVAGGKWDYIMCQNPIDDFPHEFWEMIWEQNVCVIAMLSQEVEDGRVRCRRYWPENEGESGALVFGDYRVTCEVVGDIKKRDQTRTGARSLTTCSNLSTSHIVVQRSGMEECRKVWHLQYVGWPERGVPEKTEDFLAFVEELESVRRLAEDSMADDRAVPPIVIHCASGAGRSGVLVLCDLMRHSLEHNEPTTVHEMLRMLREQRMDAVQTVTQYNFVYQVLILFLNNSRLI